MENMDQEITLDIRDILNVIKKRAKLIVIITLAATLISGVLSFFVIKPTYEASISIVVGKDLNQNGQRVQYDNNDIMMYQNLLKTYAKIAGSRTVAEKTINQLNLDITPEDLLNSVTITPQTDTQILEIKVQNKSPNTAMEIVNTLSNQFIDESKRIYPDGNVQIIDSAALPNKPVKPNKMLNIAIAFLLGLMVSIGISFLLEYMDNTIKTETDVERYLGLPVVGIIPKNDEH